MNRREEIREAFGRIRAEESIKEKTRDYLADRIRRRESPGRNRGRRLLPIAVCAFILLAGLGGYGLYFTPVALISIDINPSVELGVNRFDRIVSVEGYREEGARLAEALDVRFKEYTDAIRLVLADESVENYLAQDEILSVVVVDSDEERSRVMLSRIEACMSGRENIYCDATDAERVAGAHAAGMSCGKYHAYLEAQALDPGVTAEQISGMTTREIHDMLGHLSCDSPDGEQHGGGSGGWHGGHGPGHGH